MLLSLLVVAVVKISAVKAPAAKVAVVASVDTTTVTSAEFYARVEASGASMKDAMEKAAATLTVVKAQPELRLRLLVKNVVIVEDGCIVTKAATVQTEIIGEKTDKGS